jgi:valyl-tRNA synthetase
MSTEFEVTLSKVYQADIAETYWYQAWNDAGLFQPRSDRDPAAEEKDGSQPYVIMMPPPNVTGSLHMGHALTATIQDILIRYHRMMGYNTLYLPGTDHAGIATQTVVERELLKNEGKTRQELGRESFLERIWAWKEKNGSRILEQLRTIGVSADWNRLHFTMDDQCSRAVNQAFVQMWEDGLIYRGERLVNWDPITRTALSDEEVEHEDRDGSLWQFAYVLEDDSGEIIVATTRPETMLGDTAVAVHPDDERYSDMIGKHVKHPFFADRKIPIIADSYVDPTFGTGAVKITPAHDPNDFEMGQRHQLPMITMMTFDGHINDQGGEFKGLTRERARTAVKQKLATLGLERGEEQIRHSVSISQRSGAVIEPMLSRQYFVRTQSLADLANQALHSGETRIIPENWVKTWDHFMLHIRDWCISRQLWWGHRIPVYYDIEKLATVIEQDAHKTGGESEALRALQRYRTDNDVKIQEVLSVALNTLDESAVREFSVASLEDLCQGEDAQRYIQEEDVLDTWFSSGLWPFSTLGWPNQSDDLTRFYPGAVLETGFDILFFWVARMMMMGTYFMGKAPFADVYLHAMVRDSQGRKMSKSLGNTIDPLDVIRGITLDELLDKTQTYPVPKKLLPQVLSGLKKEFPEGIPASGADGLRFTLASLSGQGRDIRLSIPRVAGYRAFLNKIWNATRFALMRIEDTVIQPLADVESDLSLADRWILSRLQKVTQTANQGIKGYRFNETADAIYHFFWSELCDWYIELIKTALSSKAPAHTRSATCSVLMHVLDQSMRLLHPICPFQSEEIWQKLPGRHTRWPEHPFCAEAPYPQVDAQYLNESAENLMNLLQNSLTMARNARHESGIPIQKKAEIVMLSDHTELRDTLTQYETALKRMGQMSSLSIYSRQEYTAPQQAAINASADIDVIVLLEGLIDLAAEKERLHKEKEKLLKQKSLVEKRLNSEQFRAKAPEKVVRKNEETLADINQQISKIEARIDSL